MEEIAPWQSSMDNDCVMNCCVCCEGTNGQINAVEVHDEREYQLFADEGKRLAEETTTQIFTRAYAC